MCRRAHVPLALAAALVGALVAPPRPPARRTRLRSMREFRAAEVTLERFIGELGVVEVTDWEYSGELANPLDPAQPARTKRDFATDGPPVRLFLAAVDDPGARARGEDTRVALREYSGTAAAVAARELETQRGGARGVVALRGTLDDDERGFFGSGAAQDPAFVEAWVANLGTEPPKVGASWLIFDWSGTATVANLCGPKTARGNPLYAPPPPRRGFGFGGGGGAAWTFRQRYAYVRAVARGMVEALARLHESGFSHRSLSAAAFALDSKGQDKNVLPTNAPLLEVKLQFLGFSEAATAAEINDDLNALGYVLLELLLSPALADDDLVDPPAADQDTLKRLWDDIFDRDIAKLRDYADAEEGWRNAVDLLDAKDGAGWDLLATALNANDASKRSGLSFLSARALLDSPFFKR